MTLEILKRITQGFRLSKPQAEPRWRTPACLDRGRLGEASLAVDSKGFGTVLWDNAGNLWTMPVGPHSVAALARVPLGDGTAPRILMNAQGHGVALWLDSVDGERQILGKILGGGETLAHPVFATTGSIRHLQGAIDRRGNVLVTWLHELNGQGEVLAQSFDSREASWAGEPSRLAPPTAEALTPRMAVNHREHAMVLWEAREPDFEGLLASHFWPKDRLWSDHPVPVVASPTQHHQVAMDDSGNALAVWVQSTRGRRTHLEASRFDAHTGDWGVIEILGTAPALSAPRLVMNGQGEALVVWCQGDALSSARLYARAFRGGRWEAEVRSLDPDRGAVTDFAVALDAGGQAGILTLHQGAQGDLAVARLRDPEWSEPAPLGGPAGGPLSMPRLTLSPQGAFAHWIQGDGGHKALVLAKTH